MHKSDQNSITILLADDDEEDRMLTQEALEETQINLVLRFAENGVEVLDYLHNRGKFSDLSKNPIPDLILLDLNMPKKDGREVLGEIKRQSQFQRIPVVIFTTSNDEENIKKMYELGVNSYITKPVSYQGLVDAMNSLKTYWVKTVSLPPKENK
ncbi:MAG: response regulator [Bacteroidota bacterium]